MTKLKITLLANPRLFISISFILICIGLLVTPLLYAKPFANKQVQDAISSDSFFVSISPLHPEIAVFTEEPDQDVQVHFITLKRKALIFWHVESTSTQEILNQSGDKTTSEIINELTDEIKSEKLLSGNDIDVDEMSEYDKLVKEYNSKEYETLGEYSNEAGDKVLTLHSATNGSYLALNNDKLNVGNNISAPAISGTGDMACYSKYSSTGEHASHDGKIYCLNTNDYTETVVYEFPKGTYMSLGVNDTYVIYSLSTGEIGVIDLTTSEKTTIVTLEMLPESDPNKVIYVDEFEVIINPNDLEKIANDNNRLITLNLESKSWEEN